MWYFQDILTPVSLSDLRPDVYPYESATAQYVAPSPPSSAAQRIGSLVQSLPDLEADVLTLVYCHGLTQEVAAQVLSLSQSTVARRLASALSRLCYWFTRPDIHPSEVRAGLSGMVDARGWPLFSPEVVEIVTDYTQTGNSSLTARRLGCHQQDVHKTVKRVQDRLKAVNTITALFYASQIADAQARPVRVRQREQSDGFQPCAYQPEPPAESAFFPTP